MSLWQQMMIALARSRTVRKLVQGSPLMNGLATRFVGGPDVRTAAGKAAELHGRGLRASLYYLGEYVDSVKLVEENVRQKMAIARALGEAGLDVHVSVDPTQVGFTMADELGESNVIRIGRVVAEQPRRGRNLLMLDMEDFAYVAKTLHLHAHLVREGIPTAITLQAYLHRSENDLRRLIAEGATVRLVKGAFAENQERAWRRKGEIGRRYVELARLLLSPEARETGVYPIFATHDHQMIDAIRPMLRENGWTASSYEFEMLYGVRPLLQKQLVDEGHTVRLYVPFGTEWWPYTARRIGENPANAKLVIRALQHNETTHRQQPGRS